MRILVVSQYFWPEGFRINAVVNSLVKRGIKVDVLTGKPNYPKGRIFSGYKFWGYQKENLDGAEVHRVPLVPRGQTKHFGLALNYISFIFFALINGSWKLRKKQYDVIFVYGVSPILSAIPALFIGWLKNKKVIIWVQDLWPESLSATGYIQNQSIISLVRQVVKFIYQRADLLLVQSPAFEQPVRALSNTTPIEYYPNSVDDIFVLPAKSDLPDVTGFDEGFSVMFAGNIGTAQAVNVIVEAATLLKKHSDIHFVVLGDGSCRQEMLDAAKQGGLVNLHLPGRFPENTMPGFMQKASALLVTLADDPIFSVTVPNKIQAYLAAGRPIIACLNGEGARLVVGADAGLSTPAEDAEALADTVLQLYKMSSTERKKMGDNGRKYYQEHFDHEFLVGELIEHMQKMSDTSKEMK